MKNQLMAGAFLITLVLLLSILLLGSVMDNEREQYIEGEVQRLYNDLAEVQTFFLMEETYGDQMACLAFRSKLLELDKTVWNLGIKLDQYRTASEDFHRSPFYLEQKEQFNENQVFYMMLLTKLKRTCNYDDQAIISFFYQNSADCRSCDDQSFVLTDINRQLDEQISIFSYDVDLNLTTVSLLTEFYNITEYPCVVIEEEAYCGMRDKEFIMERICEHMPTIQSCQDTTS